MVVDGARVLALFSVGMDGVLGGSWEETQGWLGGGWKAARRATGGKSQVHPPRFNVQCGLPEEG